MVRSIAKYVVAHTYKPLLVKYLSSNRRYYSHGLRLDISHEVFHPGFFFSTKLLLKYISRYPLQGKSLLELGAGSGLISMHAAGKGAMVTATDINPTAIEFLQKNSLQNRVDLRIIQSDLFNHIPLQPFDLIAINPPFYKKDPLTPAGHAWYCGSKGQYFERLFNGLGNYVHDDSEVLMVLCEGCDLVMVHEMAAQNGFSMPCVHEASALLEKHFIFKIKRH
jgi:release factor glutamine methyltransferase